MLLGVKTGVPVEGGVALVNGYALIGKLAGKDVCLAECLTTVGMSVK